MLWKRQPPQRKGELNWREVRLVPKKGLEPPHPCEYVDLNHARLPIPPLRHFSTTCRIRGLLALAASTPARFIFSEMAQVVNLSEAWLHLAWPGTTCGREWTSCHARNSRESMPANSDKPAAQDAEMIPEDLALEIRRLAHDLSNALEIIVQTSYLLSSAELKEPASAWLSMLNSGVGKCLDINLELRKYIKAHTAK